MSDVASVAAAAVNVYQHITLLFVSSLDGCTECNWLEGVAEFAVVVKEDLFCQQQRTHAQ